MDLGLDGGMGTTVLKEDDESKRELPCMLSGNDTGEPKSSRVGLPIEEVVLCG